MSINEIKHPFLTQDVFALLVSQYTVISNNLHLNSFYFYIFDCISVLFIHAVLIPVHISCNYLCH